MLAIRQKRKVIDKKVIIDIPENFGSEVEVIILSDINDKSIEYWSKEEIERMGLTTSVLKDIDDEDYSKWQEKFS
jgi:hypothetical protein